MTARIASTGWPPVATAEEAQSFHDVDDMPPPPVAPTKFGNVHLWVAAAALLLTLTTWTGLLVADMLDHSDDLELAAGPTVTVTHTHHTITSTAANEGFAAGFADGYCNTPRRFGQTGPRPGCTNQPESSES